MGEKWRVTVEQWREDFDDGESVGWSWAEVSTLVAERGQLARFAPGVVADALGTVAVTPAMVPSVGASVLDEPIPYVLAEPAPAEDKPKRPRRTKAQIEADRAREAAEVAQQDAAEVAVTDAGPDAYPSPDAVPNGNEAPAAPYNPFAPK